MPLQFPSQDLTNQFISNSYQGIVQQYLPTGSFLYLLDGIGNVILQIPSASYGGILLTQDQTSSYASRSLNSTTASYSLTSTLSSVALIADAALSASISDTASLAIHALSASNAINAQTAIIATSSLSSDFAIMSGQTISSSYASTASILTGNVISASYSNTSSYAINSLTSSYTTRYTSANTTIDNTSATYTFTHGLGISPSIVNVWFVCVSDDAGTNYKNGDQVHYTAWWDSQDSMPAFYISCNTSSVIITVAGAPMLGNEVNFSTLTKTLANGFTSPSSWNNFKLKVLAQI